MLRLNFTANFAECFDLLDLFEHEKGLSTYVTVSVSNVATSNLGNKHGIKKWAVIGRTYIVEVGTVIQTDIQTDRQTDRQKNKKKKRQTERNKEINK